VHFDYGQFSGRASALFATGGMADTLRLSAWRGRFFGPEDDRKGASPVAVLGFRFAESRFGKPEDAIGKVLMIDGVPVEVIGVSPPRFFGLQVGYGTDIFLPASAITGIRRSEQYLDSVTLLWLKIYARRQSSETPGQVSARVQSAWPEILKQLVPANRTGAARARFLSQRIVITPGERGVSPLEKDFRNWLLGLVALTAFLTLLALINIASLTFGRILARSSELSIRAALGASRWRLVAVQLNEWLVIAGGVCFGSVLLGYIASRYISSLFVLESAALYLDLTPSWRVIGTTVVCILAAAICLGLAPLIWLRRGGTASFIHMAGGDRSALGRRRRVVNRLLTSAQIGLVMPLVVVAALVCNSLVELNRVDLGYRPDRVAVFELEARNGSYQGIDAGSYYQDLLRQVRALPATRSASLALNRPLLPAGWTETITAPDRPNDDLTAAMNCVGPDYFRTMSIPFIRGADFSGAVRSSPPLSAIISESLGQHLYPEADPVGRMVAIGAGNTRGNFEIVGVVRDARVHDLRIGKYNDVYLPCFEQPRLLNSLDLIVSAKSKASFIPAISRTVDAMGVERVGLATEVTTIIKRSLVRERVLAILGAVLAGLAVLLSCVGIFGLTAYTMRERRKELAIRMALGAEPARVIAQILREHLSYVAAGVIAGAFCSVWLVRIIGTQVYGVGQRERIVYAGAVLLSLILSGATVAVSAVRAVRADPAEVLHEQ
jgi:predicted permease